MIDLEISLFRCWRRWDAGYDGLIRRFCAIGVGGWNLQRKARECESGTKKSLPCYPPGLFFAIFRISLFLKRFIGVISEHVTKHGAPEEEDEMMDSQETAVSSKNAIWLQCTCERLKEVFLRNESVSVSFEIKEEYRKFLLLSFRLFSATISSWVSSCSRLKQSRQHSMCSSSSASFTSKKWAKLYTAVFLVDDISLPSWSSLHVSYIVILLLLRSLCFSASLKSQTGADWNFALWWT